MGDEKLSISKDATYGGIIVILVVLLAASVLTAGFGVVKEEPPQCVIDDGNQTQAEETLEQGTEEETTVEEEEPEPEFMINPDELQAVPLELAGSNPAKGQESAPVTIVEFSDYQCPFCAAAEGKNIMTSAGVGIIDYLKSRDPTYEAAMSKVKTEYVDAGKVNVYFRDIPFHEKSMMTIIGARCAGEQGKFWEMHDKLFEGQADWEYLSDEGVNDTMKTYAAEIGLDQTAFDACLGTETYEQEINEDLSTFYALGFGGTPAFVLVLDAERTDLGELSDAVTSGQYGLAKNGDGDYLVTVSGAAPFGDFDRIIQTVN